MVVLRDRARKKGMDNVRMRSVPPTVDDATILVELEPLGPGYASCSITVNGSCTGSGTICERRAARGRYGCRSHEPERPLAGIVLTHAAFSCFVSRLSRDQRSLCRSVLGYDFDAV